MQNNNSISNIRHPTSILVTGGAGFIGSNFIPYFIEKYPNYRIINLDLLSYAGDLDNLKEVDKILDNKAFNIKHSTSQDDRYYFIKGSICNRELVEFIFKEYDIRGVIHFAAESHVDNSIKNPEIFIETNVKGTFTLLNAAYKHWMEAPNRYYSKFKIDNSTLPRFHHISTDEVYGTLGKTGLFTENTPYAPNSPYSASKASSDMIVRSYYHTYGMNTIITNCSNNYGPKQHDEKLIPTIIRKALAGEPIPIYGDGQNVRDWLYVLDHCRGIDLVYHTGRAGETYNIGGKNERTNIYIADKICEILDELYPMKGDLSSGRTIQSYKNLITFVTDRAGHDKRYAIDAAKIESKLGWRAGENFESGLIKTIKWYLKKYTEIKV